MNNKLGGPRTEQGKARSSQNATKHGLRSNKRFVLQNENPDAWHAMLDACVEEFEPVNMFERKLVEEIAFAKWRLRRAWTVETALWDNEMEEQAEAFTRKYEAADEGMRQAIAFKALADNGKALSLIGRYQSRLQREYRNAIKTLEDRRKSRDHQTTENEIREDVGVATQKLPNEPKEPPIAINRQQNALPANLPNEPHLFQMPDEPIVDSRSVFNTFATEPPTCGHL